jgi:plasmid stability protein
MIRYHVGMKAQAQEIQYTIRGIPPEVDQALRQKAAKRQRSLNQIVVEELTTAMVGSTKHADFTDLVGKWTVDPAFDEIVASQRQIDHEKWT